LLLQYHNRNKIEAGCDEAGRGCLAGPVVAGAVILPLDFKNDLLNDSKTLSEKKRYYLRDVILKESISWGLGIVSNEEIDEINILNASFLAMHRAIDDVVNKLSITRDNTHLLVDGNDFTPYMFYSDDCLLQSRNTTIEKGDNKITSIAAASILAKVSRDTYVTDLCAKDPELDDKYGLIKNKGYGTKQHLSGIEQYGISKHHRTTFGICRNYSKH